MVNTKPSFVYTDENIEAILLGTSLQRLKKYQQLANNPNNKKESLDLYVWNARISAALLWALQGFEITLRNKIDEIFRTDFEPEWLYNYQHPCKSPLFFTDYQQEQISAIIQKLAFYNAKTGKKTYPSHQKILANLQWGVWSGFFESHQIFNKTLWKMFKNRPVPFLRETINTNIKAMKDFRNRIAHHEPILDLEPEKLHDQVLEAINWFNPEIKAWVEHHSTFPELWEELIVEKTTRGWKF